MDQIKNRQSSEHDMKSGIKELSEQELSGITGGIWNPFSSGQKTLTGSVKQADGSFKEQSVTVSRQLYKQAEAEKKANGGQPGSIYKAIFSDLGPK
jgi:bacteriocin-like protein